MTLPRRAGEWRVTALVAFAATLAACTFGPESANAIPALTTRSEGCVRTSPGRPVMWVADVPGQFTSTPITFNTVALNDPVDLVVTGVKVLTGYLDEAGVVIGGPWPQESSASWRKVPNAVGATLPALSAGEYVLVFGLEPAAGKTSGRASGVTITYTANGQQGTWTAARAARVTSKCS